jgi:phospholipid transport system substrate-binding protein
MKRRTFLAASALALAFAGAPAYAAVTGPQAEQFINNLGDAAIGSLTGKNLSEQEREARFRTLFESHFDLPGLSQFVLGRYWKRATDAQRQEFQKLFEKLLVQNYAKTFAQYAGERFKATGSRPNDDGSVIVSSTINRPNGDVIRLDWRIDQVGSGLKITDLLVEGVSLRTTHRSDFASAIQSGGGTVAGLLDALRQKVGGAQ